MLSKVGRSSGRLMRQLVAFRGLDRSDGAGEGDFIHQQGLSPARYPLLSPARSDRVEPVEGGDGLFVWNGHRVLAAAGQLWYDDRALCNVTGGAKEFAVVNSLLVVWPDAIGVDLTHGRVVQLGARAVNAGQALFGADTFTLLPRSVYARTTLRYRSSDARVPWLWTYTQVQWTAEAGWVCEGGQWLRADGCVGRYCLPPVVYSERSGSYSAQLPQSVYSRNPPEQPGQPDNGEGFCTLITGLEDYSQSGTDYLCHLAAEVYWLARNGTALDGLFRTGDAVSITGTPLGLLDADRAIVRAVDPDTNTLTFDPGTFLAGEAAQVTGDYREETLGLFYTAGDKVHRYRVRGVTARQGQYLVLDPSQSAARLYDGKRQLIGQFEAEPVSSLSTLTTLELVPLRDTQLPVEVLRPIPSLDHICHHENRLWGVSNADNCIYASALGDPRTFYLYDGLATDSYTVAVGSQGPFTGICSFAGAVLCWKEHGVHKVLGSLPENYQLALYPVSGVGRGSGKSLVNVEGRLYYLGRDGVYSYTGSSPVRISRALGLDSYENGVAGTDGKYYYLSASRAGHGPELLVFDPETGLWWRRDGTCAADFARTDRGLALLDETGVRTLEAGEGFVDFEGVLAPMEEGLEQVQYHALTLRCHLGEGAWLQVDVRRDGGDWQQAGLLHGQGHRTDQLRLPLGRCARLEVRLRGHGDCQLSHLCREYRKRGGG